MKNWFKEHKIDIFEAMDPHQETTQHTGFGDSPKLPERAGYIDFIHDRSNIIETFSHSILPLHLDDVASEFSFKTLKRFARGLETSRWTPDTAVLLKGLRASEFIDLLSLMKDEKKRFQLSQAFALEKACNAELFRKVIGLQGTPDESTIGRQREWFKNAFHLLEKIDTPLNQESIRKVISHYGKSDSLKQRSHNAHFRADWLYLRDRGDETERKFPSGCAAWAGFGEVYNEGAKQELRLFKTILVESRPGELYMDTPMGIMLSYKGIPQAVVGFFLDQQDAGCIHIKQIQGVVALRPQAEVGHVERYPTRGLPKLHWENALVEIVEDLARSLEVTKVRITSADNNQWNGHVSYASRRTLTATQAFLRYDRTALQSGYERSDQTRDFIKEIN